MAGQLPVIPLYVDSLGGTAEQVGWVMGSFAIGLLALRPQLGRCADRIGRVSVMRIGLLVATVIPLCYALFPAIPLIMFFRAVHGISIAAFATGFSALVADLAPAPIRGKIVGYMTIVNPVGFAIGPVVGDWLAKTYGYPWLFGAVAGVGGTALLLTYGLAEVIPTAKAEDFSQNLPLWRTWWHPRIRVPAMVLLLVGLAFGILTAFMPLFLKQVGIRMNVGLFYLAAALSGIVTRLQLANWSDRWGRGIFVSLGICGYALSSWIMYRAENPEMVLLSGAMEGLGAGLVIPSIITITADRTTMQERGTVMGLVWMGFDLGIALAGPAVGSLIQFVGLQNTFIVGTALTILGLVIFSSQSSGTLRGSWRFATGRGKDYWAI